MKYGIAMFLALLVGCSNQENTVQENTKASPKPEALTASEIQGNSLYDKDVHELRKVYANSKGQDCITLSKRIRGITDQHTYNTIDQSVFEASCKEYVKKTPYSLEEILDPKAIAIFQHEILKFSCMENEKTVVFKRQPKCEQFFTEKS